MKRVIKVGGSLLDSDDWPKLLAQWLQRQSHGQNLLIVGGGRLVDGIRHIDEMCRIDPLITHEAALRAMEINTDLAATRISNWPIATLHKDSTWELVAIAANTWLKTANWAIGCQQFDRSWETTSDSIALVIGNKFAVSEVVLLKSALPPSTGKDQSSMSIRSICSRLSSVGFIDRGFAAHLQSKVTIRLVNLLAIDFSEMRLQP